MLETVSEGFLRQLANPDFRRVGEQEAYEWISPNRQREIRLELSHSNGYDWAFLTLKAPLTFNLREKEPKMHEAMSLVIGERLRPGGDRRVTLYQWAVAEGWSFHTQDLAVQIGVRANYRWNRTTIWSYARDNEEIEANRTWLNQQGLPKFCDVPVWINFGNTAAEFIRQVSGYLADPREFDKAPLTLPFISLVNGE